VTPDVRVFAQPLASGMAECQRTVFLASG